MSDRSKQTAIITGGTKGLGAAIAKEFYKQGMHVVLAARSDNGVAKRLGSRARFFKMDVRRPIDHQGLFNVASQWTKRVDVLVNCAGFSQWRSIDQVDEEFVNDMIDTNLKGYIWGCKFAAKHLSKGGSIINVSSLAGKRGSANNAVYCTSKFGVTGLTQALAKELGPRGIRVNAVCPVYVQTPGLLKALGDQQSPSKGKNIRAYLKNFAEKETALGRLPLGREIAKTCYFLASQESSAITGQSLNVDCGVLPQ